MKTLLTTLSFLPIIMIFSRCNNNDDVRANNKNLRQNMGDMGMYHDNLGTALRKENLDNSIWLMEGLDSSLQVIATTFDQHRKLNVPFEESYHKKLQPHLKDIREALKENDFPNAIKGYRLLTNNCNSCHKDLDIDEEIVDYTDPDRN